MAHGCRITPFVNVADPCRGIDFYERMLGFRATFVTDGVYAFLRRDEIAIRWLRIGSGIDLSVPERQNAFYIDVTGVDALYDTLRPALDTPPSGRVRPPSATGPLPCLTGSGSRTDCTRSVADDVCVESVNL